MLRLRTPLIHFFPMHIAPTTYSWGKTNILGHKITDIMSSLVLGWIEKCVFLCQFQSKMARIC